MTAGPERPDGIVPAFRYRAFLSYSRKDDTWGRWLHRAIESYRIPKDLVGKLGHHGIIPQRLYPIFRDRDELAATQDLSETIQGALAASEFLIVICSPSAARSRWVNQEVLEFKRLGRGAGILAVIADGEPGASLAGASERECFPPALLFEIDAQDGLTDRPAAEPLAADLRSNGDGRSDGLLKLVAGLLGTSFDTLKRRDEAARRKRLRAWIVGLSVIVIGMACLSTVAMWQRSVAIAERERAEQALQAANSASVGLINELAQGTKNWVGINQVFVSRILTRAQNVLLSVLAVQPDDEKEVRRSLAIVYSEMAVSQNAIGHTDNARYLIDDAIRMFELLHLQNPNDLAITRDLLIVHRRKGEILTNQDRLEEAVQAYTAGLAKANELYAAPDKRIEWLVEISQYKTRLAMVAEQMNQPDEYRRYVLSAHEDLLKVAGSPETRSLDDSYQMKKYLGASYLNVAGLYEQADTSKLEEAALKAKEIFEDLRMNSKDGFGDTEVIFMLVKADQRLGEVSVAKGEVPAAIKRYEAALGGSVELIRSDPERTAWLSEFAFVADTLGGLWQKANRPDTAAHYFAEALKARLTIVSKQNTPHNQLKLAYAHYKVAATYQNVDENVIKAKAILESLKQDSDLRLAATELEAMINRLR